MTVYLDRCPGRGGAGCTSLIDPCLELCARCRRGPDPSTFARQYAGSEPRPPAGATAGGPRVSAMAAPAPAGHTLTDQEQHDQKGPTHA